MAETTARQPDAAAQPGQGRRMRAVTLSREYGSGGGEIARRLAARLKWQLVDHEVVAHVARELGVSHAEAAEQDERAEGFMARFLCALQSIEPNMLVSTPLAPSPDPKAYHEALRRVVEAAVAAGCAVIVGRGGQVLLRERRDVLHVRIMAPLDQRIRYVREREGLDEAAARARIQRKERDRALYLQTQYRCRPDDAHLYDLVINTGVLTLDDAAELICRALTLKGARLAVPEAELGPGAGLARYSTPPEDFRPPQAEAEAPR
jgi:cytidylate kinase